MDSSRERLWARRGRQARRIPLVLPLAGALLFLSVSGTTAAGPTVEAAGGASGYYWSPSSASTTPGGSVILKNPSASVLHGVGWSSGPETPSCAGMPINDASTGWSGECSFTQTGTYAYVCTVHPEMKGTIAVGSGDPGAPGPAPPGTSDDPVASGLRIAERQRGRVVRGSVQVQEDGAKLDVRLFAARKVLFGKGSGKAPVGSIVRSARSGQVRFSVPLKRVARLALSSRAVLPLSAKVTVVGQSGDRYERTSRLLLRSENSSTGGSG